MPAGILMQELAPEMPRVLVVSETCVSSAHGTGTVLLRHFAGYPSEKLANAYCHRAGEAAWKNAFAFEVRGRRGRGVGSAGTLLIRLYNAIVRRLGLMGLYYNRTIEFAPGPADAIAQAFVPDVVYSVAYSEAGLALQDHVLRKLPPGIPVIQYFMDFQFPRGLFRTRYLRRALPRAAEVWSLTQEIALALAPHLPSNDARVRVQPAFHLDLPKHAKREHRPAEAAGFTCVIAGNFWQDALALVVKRIWRRVMEAVPGVGPILWYSHPDSVRRTRDAVGDLGPEIQPSGFHVGEDLLQRLLDADMAIVPFNAARHPENDYARYSLPSRLTELLAVGLPIFCIAGSETPVGRYLARDGLGVVCDAEDEERLARRLVDFVRSREEREAVGTRGRKFARGQFALPAFQHRLWSNLARLARGER